MSLSPEPAGDASPPRSLHILVIEDNPDGRESMRLLLERWGHRVDVAADGPAGVEQALALRPNLVLCDIGLPGLDGYGVAQTVREALGAGVFLIAYTAYDRPEYRRRAVEAGFDALLIKPLQMAQLLTLLDDLTGA